MRFLLFNLVVVAALFYLMAGGRIASVDEILSSDRTDAAPAQTRDTVRATKRTPQEFLAAFREAIARDDTQKRAKKNRYAASPKNDEASTLADRQRESTAPQDRLARAADQAEASLDEPAAQRRVAIEPRDPAQRKGGTTGEGYPVPPKPGSSAKRPAPPTEKPAPLPGVPERAAADGPLPATPPKAPSAGPKTVTSAPQPLAGEVASAYGPVRTVPVSDPAVLKRRAEVLGEAPKTIAAPPQIEGPFMSSRERRRELNRLAQAMELLFAEKLGK